MLKLKDNVELKELEMYLIPVCHTCFVDDSLNTYRFRFKCTLYDEIEITNKQIHFGNSKCEWLENIYDLIKADLIEKVDD